MTEQTSEAKAKDAAVEKVRPLNATQTRNLTKLVEGDFNSMRSELRQFADEQIKMKTEEIKAQASYQRMAEIREKAKEMTRKYNDALSSLSVEAHRDGIQLSYRAVSSEMISVNDSTVQNKINAATQEINTELKTALLVLDRKEIEAQRKILIASITSDAEAIMNSIPNAKQLMAEAAAEREERRKAITAQVRPQ